MCWSRGLAISRWRSLPDCLSVCLSVWAVRDVSTPWPTEEGVRRLLLIVAAGRLLSRGWLGAGWEGANSANSSGGLARGGCAAMGPAQATAWEEVQGGCLPMNITVHQVVKSGPCECGCELLPWSRFISRGSRVRVQVSLTSVISDSV